MLQLIRYPPAQIRSVHIAYTMSLPARHSIQRHSVSTSPLRALQPTLHRTVLPSRCRRMSVLLGRRHTYDPSWRLARWSRARRSRKCARRRTERRRPATKTSCQRHKAHRCGPRCTSPPSADPRPQDTYAKRCTRRHQRAQTCRAHRESAWPRRRTRGRRDSRHTRGLKKHQLLPSHTRWDWCTCAARGTHGRSCRSAPRTCIAHLDTRQGAWSNRDPTTS